MRVGGREMSYWFGMSFVKCKKDELLKKMQEMKENDLNKEYAEKLIKDNIWYRPSMDIEDTQLRVWKWNKWWVEKLFTHRYVYWEKYELLGVSSEILAHGFTTQIYFQNSSDQNYEYNEWSGIPEFEETVKSIRGLSNETILEGYVEDVEECNDKDEVIEYARKTLVYNKIYEMLELDNWLWGRDGRYTRYTVCSLDTEEKVFEMDRIACKYEKEFNESDSSYKEKRKKLSRKKKKQKRKKAFVRNYKNSR